MKLQSFLYAGVLAILTLTVASAKTYDVKFTAATKAGDLQLKPSDYTIKIDGSKITFIEAKSKKAFTTDIKVENAPKSFEFTRVDASNEGGTSVLKDIELGGSKIKVDF